MRVGIVTYAAPHLKTQRVLALLALLPGLRLSLHAVPFNPRPARAPLVRHRPEQMVGPDPTTLSRFYGIPCQYVASAEELDITFDVGLIAGAGVLPGSLVERVPFVNAHPGLIPAVRGLDAFKWAIVDGKPLGCTLHTIDQEVDRGRSLATVQTPVYADDTLAALAMRHYESEIALLGAFARFLAEPQPSPALPEGELHKRMPRQVEDGLHEAFAEYVYRFGVAGVGP